MNIRYGILVADESVCRAHWRSIEQLQSIDDVACVAVIPAREQPALPFGTRSVSGLRPVDLLSSLPAVQRVDTASVEGLGLDFILNCTFLPPDPILLKAAAQGVWMFFYGNPARNGAWPPAWSEIEGGDSLTIIELRRLGESDALLGHCIVPTDRASYRANLQNALTAGIDLPNRAIRNLRAGRGNDLKEAASPAALPRPLRIAQKSRFQIRLATAWAMLQLRSMLFSEDWNVGIVEAPIASFLDPQFIPKIAWLPRQHGRARFVADPFAIPSAKGLTLLVEEFDNDRYQGFLSTIAWVPGGPVPPPRTILDERKHMSYPFPVEHDGDLFVIPETSSKREVALYRLDLSAGTCVRARLLISDFAGLDATVVHHDSMWWLFCTSKDELPECKLYLYYSDDLLGPWIPHGLNPVKCDARSSRPGGTPFVADGKLYRPAQDASNGYGGALTINLVTVLTRDQFEEQPIRSLGPIPGSPYPDGLHTLSAAGSRTLIDGKRLVFTPERISRRVLHKMRRIRETLLH
jgi:hypothetical protein